MTSRISLACLSLITVLLAGCQTSSNSAATGTAVSKVDVQVYTLQRTALPEGSTVRVRLVDATNSDKLKVISEESISTRNQPPYGFVLGFNPREIDPTHVYEVLVDLTQPDGTKWTQLRIFPVLTGGAPAYVEVPVGPH